MQPSQVTVLPSNLTSKFQAKCLHAGCRWFSFFPTRVKAELEAKGHEEEVHGR